jgi:ankyrin repeat protein
MTRTNPVGLVVFLLAALAPVSSAKPLPLEPPDPGRGIIGVRIKVIPPAHIGSNYADAVYFVRVVEDADRFSADTLINSNYSDGHDVYLLNAKPGRYVAVGCRLTIKSGPAGPAAPAPGLQVGLAFSPAPAAAVFSQADILQSEVEVRAGAVAFMGAIEAQSSTKVRESDPAQAHYLSLVSPAAAHQSAFVRALSGNLVYTAAFKSIERSQAAEAAFWDEAIGKHFTNEMAWVSRIAHGSSAPVSGAAGSTSTAAAPSISPGGTDATSSNDVFVSAVCVDVNKVKARANGQPKEAAEIARLVCQTVMTDWGTQGCRENSDQPACRKRLASFDGSLKSSGSSMLFAAAQAGQTSICSVMLATGSDPNAVTSTGWTPLMIAAAENRPATVKLLLDKGASLEAKNADGKTPAALATEAGHPEIVELLKKAPEGAPSTADEAAATTVAAPPPPDAPAGATPSDDELVAGACIEANAQKFRADGKKEAEAKEMAGLVCRIVMKAWGSNGCRNNPDQDACKQTLGVLDTDLKASGISMLFGAAQVGRTDICSVMISMGSDPNAAISTSWTPVMIAAAENKPETVRLLLAKGANPNARNSVGRTPVMFAANYGYTEIVDMLTKAGADVNVEATDKERKSALIAAACNGHAGTVAVLLRLGAHAEAVDADGFNALAHASLDGKLEVMRALLDGGAEINSGALVGTPLAMASAEGRVDAVKLLLERGADVNRPYRSAQAGLEGITPLMIAAGEGQVEVVQLLVAAGADLNARNSRGSTALDLASTAGKANVVEILRQAARP